MNNNDNIIFEEQKFNPAKSMSPQLDIVVPIDTGETFYSLYDELLVKCKPERFLEPYDFEKSQYANYLYQRILKCDKNDETNLKRIRNEAISKLEIKISTIREYNTIWRKYDPKQFTGTYYNAECFEIANIIRQEAMENADNIEVLEQLLLKANEKLSEEIERVRIEKERIRKEAERVASVAREERRKIEEERKEGERRRDNIEILVLLVFSLLFLFVIFAIIFK